jgi:E3 ubiquitin-protein ligase synoviolin
MEQSAHIPRKFHVRMVGLLSLLWIVDVALVLFAVESILLEGPTVMIMFANEVSAALLN